MELTSPFAMTNAVVTIGLGHGAETFEDYTEAVSQAELQPSSSSGTWTGVGGNQISFAGATTWNAVIALAQDDDANGLSDFLFDHDGEKATMRLYPQAGGRGWEVDVTLTPTAIGGTAGPNPATGTATFPVVGKPRKIAAPVPEA